MHSILIVNIMISWIFLIADVSAEVPYISVDAGDTVDLPCTSRTKPSSWQHQTGPLATLFYVWVEESITPKYGHRFKVPLVNRSNYTLVIYNVTIADSGTYHCVEAQETNGAKEHSVHLTVIEVIASTSTVTYTHPAAVTVMVERNSWPTAAIAVVCCSLGAAVAVVAAIFIYNVMRRRKRSARPRRTDDNSEAASKTELQPLGPDRPTDAPAQASVDVAERVERVNNDAAGILWKLSLSGQVYGVTSIGNALYVLHHADKFQITVFDKTNYTVRWKLSVPGLNFYCNNIASCVHNNRLFISDCINQCIHRVDLQPSVEISKWPANSKPRGMSVTADGSVLVACKNSNVIKQFSADGKALCDIQIKRANLSPFHAVELSQGKIVVSLGYRKKVADNAAHEDKKEDDEEEEELHDVIIIDSGGNILKSFSESNPSKKLKLKAPRHLAVGEGDLIFIGDCFNDRVLSVNADLKFVRHAISHDDLLPNPYRLHYDRSVKRLYVSFVNRSHLIVIGSL